MNSQKSSFSRQLVTVLSGTVASRVLQLAATPLLLQWFLPSAVGAWQIFIGVTLLLESVATLRYELAVVLPTSDRRAASIVKACLLSASLTAAAVAVAVHALPDLIAAVIGAPSLAPLLWLLPLMTLAMGAEQACVYWMTRHQEFFGLVTLRLSKSLVVTGFPLVLSVWGRQDEVTLVAGAAAGQAVALLISSLLVLGRLRLRRAMRTPSRTMLSVAREFHAYPLYITSYSLVAQLSRRIIISLFAAFATTHIVGLFTIAMQLTMVPVGLVTIALGQVFYPRIQPLIRDESLQPFVLKILWRLAILTAPWFLVLAYLAPILSQRFLPVAWSDSGRYISAAVAPCFMLLLTSWLPRLYDALRRQRAAVAMQVGSDTIGIAVVGVVLGCGYPPYAAAVGFFAWVAVYNILWLLVTFRVAGLEIRSLAPLASCLLVLGAVTVLVCESLVGSGLLSPLWTGLLILSVFGLQAAVLWTWKAGKLNDWILARLEAFLGPAKVSAAR